LKITSPPRRRRALRHSRSFLAAAVLAASFAACDFLPTDLPHWNTLWIFPGQSTSVTVAELLPDGITVTPAGDAFEMSLQPVTFGRSLAEICPPCTLLHGAVVPKPAFDETFGDAITLPTDAVSAELTGGLIRITLTHNFGFDPLRPSATARGFIVISARSGTTTLARDSISGTTTALPSNTPVSRTLQLAPANISAPIEVSIRIVSPAGDPVQINANARFDVTASAQQVRVGSARVRVGNRTISAAPVDLDLADFDEEVAERVKEGALHLDITNPFEVSGTFRLSITAPGVDIRRNIELTPGETTQRIALSGAELRSLLGQSGVTFQGSGTVSSPPGGVTVRPADTIEIGTRLELTIGSREN
jgi:hypothetical protein